MIRLAITIILGAIIGGIMITLLAGGLPEGAVAGMVLGGSLGLLAAVHKGADDSTPAFEYETAGIHDDNLTTTARRNLVREAYRQSYEQSPRVELERRLGSARGRLLADAEPQSELAEQIQRLEYRQQTNEYRNWLAPQDRAQAYDLQLSPTVEKRKRKPKRQRLD